MKKKLTVLATTAAMAPMIAVAGPASANHLDKDEVGRFFDYPSYHYDVVDDVYYVNVRERSPSGGECFVDDVDLDGYAAEYDYTCYH
jgi:hypothetical protein